MIKEITQDDSYIHIEELHTQVQDLKDECNKLRAQEQEADTKDGRESARTALEQFFEDNQEWAQKEQFSDQVQTYAHSGTLIHERVFMEYLRDCAEDNTEVPDVLQGYIDWEALARDMGHDYTAIEWGEATFYVQ